jgi:hypothetical protein
MIMRYRYIDIVRRFLLPEVTWGCNYEWESSFRRPLQSSVHTWKNKNVKRFGRTGWRNVNFVYGLLLGYRVPSLCLFEIKKIYTKRNIFANESRNYTGEIIKYCNENLSLCDVVPQRLIEVSRSFVGSKFLNLQSRRRSLKFRVTTPLASLNIRPWECKQHILLNPQKCLLHCIVSYNKG